MACVATTLAKVPDEDEQDVDTKVYKFEGEGSLGVIFAETVDPFDEVGRAAARPPAAPWPIVARCSLIAPLFLLAFRSDRPS